MVSNERNTDRHHRADHKRRQCFYTTSSSHIKRSTARYMQIPMTVFTIRARDTSSPSSPRTDVLPVNMITAVTAVTAAAYEEVLLLRKKHATAI